MKRLLVVLAVAVLAAVVLAAGLWATGWPAPGEAARAAAAARPAQLQKLDIAIGRWVFHGKTVAAAGAAPGRKAAAWTWRADCRWSTDRRYLLCAFHNVWAGKPVESLVVDTWNSRDRSYWHYEMFSAGAGGAHPFSSRMTIRGNTWIEQSASERHGQKLRTRIVYVYSSSRRVRVKIQSSRDGKPWKTLDAGIGVKIAG